jgi:hypothetical protein
MISTAMRVYRETESGPLLFGPVCLRGALLIPSRRTFAQTQRKLEKEGLVSMKPSACGSLNTLQQPHKNYRSDHLRLSCAVSIHLRRVLLAHWLESLTATHLNHRL